METVKTDSTKRVRLPDAKPGQVFAYTPNADGTILLSPVKALERKPGILDGLKPMTDAEAAKLYKTPNAEFDALEHHCAQLPVRRPEE